MSAEKGWVEVRPYDARWPDLFDTEAGRIRSRLPPPNPEVVHFGSTAVPGLAAKPIIDILIGVHDQVDSDALSAAMENLGYEYLGEDGPLPGRFFWRKRGLDSFNVSSVPHGGPLWASNLAVRDFQRTHDDWARAYAEIKLEAVQSAGSSMLRYQDAKRAFVDELRAAAINWHRAR